MCVMWMEGWRKWLETKLGKIETNDNAPDFCHVDKQKYARKAVTGRFYV